MLDPHKKLKVESKSKQQNTNDCEKYLTAMSSVYVVCRQRIKTEKNVIHSLALSWGEIPLLLFQFLTFGFTLMTRWRG